MTLFLIFIIIFGLVTCTPSINAECSTEVYGECRVAERSNFDVTFSPTDFSTDKKDGLVFFSMETTSDDFTYEYTNLTTLRTYRSIQGYHLFRPQTHDLDGSLYITWRNGFTVFNISNWTDIRLLGGVDIEGDIVGSRSINFRNSIPIQIETSVSLFDESTDRTRMLFFDHYEREFKSCELGHKTYQHFFDDCSVRESSVISFIDRSGFFSDINFVPPTNDAERQYVYLLEQEIEKEQQSATIHIINILSDPPFRAGVFRRENNGRMNFMRVEQNGKGEPLAFVGTESGIIVLDVSDPTSPIQRHNLSIGENTEFFGMFVDEEEGKGYLASEEGFHIVDLSCILNGSCSHIFNFVLNVLKQKKSSELCSSNGKDSSDCCVLDVINVIDGSAYLLMFKSSEEQRQQESLIIDLENLNTTVQVVSSLNDAFSLKNEADDVVVLSFGAVGWLIGNISKNTQETQEREVVENSWLEWYSAYHFPTQAVSFQYLYREAEERYYCFVFDDTIWGRDLLVIRFPLEKRAEQLDEMFLRPRIEAYIDELNPSKIGFGFRDVSIDPVAQFTEDTVYLYLASGKEGLVIARLVVKTEEEEQIGNKEETIFLRAVGNTSFSVQPDFSLGSAFRVYVRGWVGVLSEKEVAEESGRAYVALDQSSFRIVNITDKEKPIQIGEIDVISYDPDKGENRKCATGAIFVEYVCPNEYAYVCSCRLYEGMFISEVQVYNVSDPSKVTLVASTENQGIHFVGCHDIIVRSRTGSSASFIFIAAGSDGLVILERHGKHFQFAGSYDLLLDAQHLQVSADMTTAYVSGKRDGLVVIDTGLSSASEEDTQQSLFIFSPKLICNTRVGGGSRSFSVEKNYIFLSSDRGISVLSTSLRVFGTKAFKFYCGKLSFMVKASDSGGTSRVEKLFPVLKDSYCNDEHGRCDVTDPHFSCECDYGYFGSQCKRFKCGDYENSDEDVCHGSGFCIAPDSCACTSFWKSGYFCEEVVMINSLVIPDSVFVGLFLVEIVFICIVACPILMCCLLFCPAFLVCSVFSCFVCCICCIGGVLLTGLVLVIYWLYQRIARFRKLKNFELHLKEQLLEEDETVAHLKFNKKLFEVSYSDIDSIAILGEGGSNSMVFKVKWRGLLCAFKCFKTRTLAAKVDSFSEFERELELLSSLAHPNIIRFFGACLHPPRVGILMEFCPHGELLDFVKDTYPQLHDGKICPFYEKIRLLAGVASAMEFLHSKNVIHRDLKCENVLISKDFEAKLMDFGLSRLVEDMSEGKTKRIGTNVYMAPEIVLKDGATYNNKIDVFSFAIMMFVVILENDKPYDNFENFQIEFSVANNPSFRPNLRRFDMESVVDQEMVEVVPKKEREWAKDLCEKCWDANPEVRYSCSRIREILEEYLKKNSKEDLKVEDLDQNQD